METKAVLNIKGLEFKLTSEKLFINSLSSNETYALRSVNGVSVKDKIELFNQEISDYKSAIARHESSKGQGIMAGAVGGFSAIYGAVSDSTLPLIFGVLLLGVMWKLFQDKHPGESEPVLKSSVVITMNSGDKSFEFVKSDANSDEVAKFVFEVEQTLTAFHKSD